MAKDRQGLHFSELNWESTEQNMAIPPRGSLEQESSASAKQEPSARGKRKTGTPADGRPQQLQMWDLAVDSRSGSAGAAPLPDKQAVEQPVPERREPAELPLSQAVPPSGDKPVKRQAAPPLPKAAAASAAAGRETESAFVEQAWELEEYTADKTRFVPFKSYWPTYSHMTAEQSQWYFYWREEVRQGRYPKSDLSYIFLHVYELINGVGWLEPLDGYRQLRLVWEAYRDQYKRLDQYLGGWLADFAFVHKLEVPLSEIVARSRGLAGDLAEIELMRCLSTAPEQLTFEALTVMSDYDISKSKFYEGEGKAAAEHYIPLVVALIDAYITRKHGAGLIEMFPPGPPVMRERYLFRSAVYDISIYGYSVLVPVVRISKSPPLRSLITRLFRLTENKLRELMGYRGRLKGIKMDADMDELITKYLQREFRKAEQEARGPAVVIDKQKLEQLESDSEVVRALLTVEGADEPFTSPEEDEQSWTTEQEVIPLVPEAELNIEQTPAFPALSQEVTQPADGGNSEWESFRNALTSLQREALIALAGENGPEAVNRIAAAGGTMPELLYDEINDLAMDLLGDLVIDGEELAEEWLPMLHYLMR